MKYKTTIIIIAIAVAFACFMPVWGNNQRSQSIPNSTVTDPALPSQEGALKNDAPAAQLADQIIVGLVSEKQFLKMHLSSDEVLEVFKEIRSQRGWGLNDEALAGTLKWYSPGALAPDMTIAQEITTQSTGSCSVFIGLENGSSSASYPVNIVAPSGDECRRGDRNDLVLVYNTPRYPNTDTSKLRVWSNLWWVRWALGWPCPNGVGANNACTPSTRVCLGLCAQGKLASFGNLWRDLHYIYLWHK